MYIICWCCNVVVTERWTGIKFLREKGVLEVGWRWFRGLPRSTHERTHLLFLLHKKSCSLLSILRSSLFNFPVSNTLIWRRSQTGRRQDGRSRVNRAEGLPDVCGMSIVRNGTWKYDITGEWPLIRKEGENPSFQRALNLGLSIVLLLIRSQQET